MKACQERFSHEYNRLCDVGLAMRAHVFLQLTFSLRLTVRRCRSRVLFAASSDRRSKSKPFCVDS